MVIFGAPYYCLELYIAYTGRKPSDLVLAIAGGAAVAPSSIDPWIFLLFWVNWNEPTNISNPRRTTQLDLQQQQQHIQSRRTTRSNTLQSSSITDPYPHNVLLPNASRLSSNTMKRNKSSKRPETLSFSDT
jgi:hypothetical protein